MAYQEVFRVDTCELIRPWQKGLSQRRIARVSGRARDTVRRYVTAARELGLEPGCPDPTDEQLAKLTELNLSTPARVAAPAADVLGPHADRIKRWLQEDRLQLTRIHELLCQRGVSVSYSSLRRFCDRQGLQGQTRSLHGPHGRPRSRPGRRTGLRTAGPDLQSRRRSPPDHLGPGPGDGLLAPHVRLAALSPKARGRGTGPGAGLGLLRRGTAVPGHRQLPGRGGRR